jgi:hypothetical protein
MTLDHFIEKRHKDLQILIKKVNTEHKSRKSPELITDLWLEMRKRSMFTGNEDDFWFFSVKYIKNRLNWKDGFDVEIGQFGVVKYKTFKKINKLEMDKDNVYESDWEDPYLSDRLSEEQMMKIEMIDLIYKTKLDFYEKQLYDWYFIEKLSVDKMTEKYNLLGSPMSRSSVYNLVKSMIQKIKDEL